MRRLKLKPAWINLFGISLIWLEFLRVFVSEWEYNDQYGYGFFVPILSLYLVWLRTGDRPKPDKFGPRPLWISLFVIAAFAYVPLRLILAGNPEWRMALWALAALSVGLTFLLLLSWGGLNWLRQFASPVILMLFSVPWPTQFEAPLTLTLMEWVASIVVETLNLLGIYAEQHGNLIALTQGLVGVEEACSGVRSFQSTIMAAFFFGAFFRWRIPGRLVLIGLGGLVSLALNIGRTLFLTLMVTFRGSEAMEVLHDSVGYLVSILSFIALFILTWAVQKLIGKDEYSPEETFPRHCSKPSWLPAFPYWTLLASLFFTFPLADWWYRRGDPVSGDRVEAVIHWDRIPEETEFKEIPPNVRALLRYSEGAHVRWVDQDQVHWQVYFFRWDAGAVSSHVNVHRPEVCLPSAGFKMEGRNAEFTWPLDTINLEFNQYLFTAPKVELHVFYAMWDDEPDQSVPLGSTGRERLEQVWQGQRIEGRYSVQFILANVRSAQTARAKVKGFLSRSLRVKE